MICAHARAAAALSDPARLPKDRERDASSKPVEVLSFFGVAPGMTVLDMNAATGWYSEILARVVGTLGRVIAHNHPGARTALSAQSFAQRYGGNRLPNVEQLFARHCELILPDASVDVVLMSMVYHDTYWHRDGVDWGPIDRAALLESIGTALKPHGIVGVVDHQAAPGADPTASAASVHRIDREVVLRDFLSAGFELDGDSDVLRSAADDYASSVFDAGVAGRTDRFVLRFRKPARRAAAELLGSRPSNVTRPVAPSS